MAQKHEFTALENTRLDKLVVENIADISRSQVQHLINSGNILANGEVVLKSYKVKVGDEITVNMKDAEETEIVAEDIPLDIVYEDNDLLVINKPKGMVVHPAPGNYTGTMVNALLHHCKDSLSGINGKIRPGIVHRIDKDTSGLLVVAKNDISHNCLAKQIKEHSFKREYRTIVYGKFKDESGTINAPLARHPKDRKKMAVVLNSPSSKEAITHYQTIEVMRDFSYIKVTLETGRTHQIRVHTAYLGKPVVGDPIYGPKNVVTELKGQCLHAAVLGFIHPTSNEYMEFVSELPTYFKVYLDKLRKR